MLSLENFPLLAAFIKDLASITSNPIPNFSASALTKATSVSKSIPSISLFLSTKSCISLSMLSNLDLVSLNNCLDILAISGLASTLLFKLLYSFKTFCKSKFFPI